MEQLVYKNMWQNIAIVIYEVNISTLEIVLILYNDALERFN